MSSSPNTPALPSRALQMQALRAQSQHYRSGLQVNRQALRRSLDRPLLWRLLSLATPTGPASLGQALPVLLPMALSGFSYLRTRRRWLPWLALAGVVGLLYWRAQAAGKATVPEAQARQ